jgi:dolichol-phosphate mannosyltransferase
MENSLFKSHKVLCAPIAFNEERKIGQVIKKLLEVCGHENILLIDDGSIDGTVRVVQDLGVSVISHKTRKGAGAAIRTAIQYGLSHQFEILVIIAGNDKDNPSEIPRLLEPIIQGDYDFVQGSRYLPVQLWKYASTGSLSMMAIPCCFPFSRGKG